MVLGGFRAPDRPTWCSGGHGRYLENRQPVVAHKSINGARLVHDPDVAYRGLMAEYYSGWGGINVPNYEPCAEHGPHHPGPVGSSLMLGG